MMIASIISMSKLSFKPESERLRIAKEEAEINRLFFSLTFWQTFSVAGSAVFFCAVLMLGYGVARHKINMSSVHQAVIGASTIPIHIQHIKNGSLAHDLTTLANAEALKQSNGGVEKALELHFALADREIAQYRALKHIASTQSELPEMAQKSLPFSTPTFASLLQNKELAPGKPLILGYSEGQPQHRTIQNLKAMAVAGWQGSGKTLSTAYIIASAVLCCDAQVYVVDPHKGHDEGLYANIQPLDQAGLIQVVNPFYMPKLINTLAQTLERRLNGTESSTQPILLVIDELARLAKSDCFDDLIKFIERCTEETRKSNITFIGCSQKWTARHFKGRADIRACMNSALVHKTKPSQADLLLEDSQDKKLVKQLEKPGDAILMTDYAGPDVVQMPFCSVQDMHSVVKMVGNGAPIVVESTPVNAVNFDNVDKPIDTPVNKGVDIFCQRVKKYIRTNFESTSKFCQQHQIDSGLLSKVLNRKRNMSKELREKLEGIVL